MEAESNGVRYYNCGAWTNAHPTYITIDAAGVQIHTWLELADIESSENLEASWGEFDLEAAL